MIQVYVPWRCCGIPWYTMAHQKVAWYFFIRACLLMCRVLICKLPLTESTIGLSKMFSRWIWGIFNIQIQSDRGHKLMLFMFQNKDKDLLGIYQYGCDPFCVSLLTDRHLKVRSNSILFTFSYKGALTSARDS